MRLIKDLVINKEEKVYVYLSDVEIGEKFLEQAETEGFTFGDGVKPTKRCFAEIMAVNDNYTINFVGSIGRMAFNSGTETIGGKKFIRVDFAKYINGESDYMYCKPYLRS